MIKNSIHLTPFFLQFDVYAQTAAFRWVNQVPVGSLTEILTVKIPESPLNTPLFFGIRCTVG